MKSENEYNQIIFYLHITRSSPSFNRVLHFSRILDYISILTASENALEFLSPLKYLSLLDSGHLFLLDPVTQVQFQGRNTI